MFRKGVYRNNKTGTLYYATGLLHDCTNATNGRLFVQYNIHYIRSLDEFLEKFTLIEADIEPGLYRYKGRTYQIATYRDLALNQHIIRINRDQLEEINSLDHYIKVK